MSKHTPGPWRPISCGGASTVVVPDRPTRNDTRIPAFGYREDMGHCVGYPFLDDDQNARLDFVCFSHADACLIAAAPDLLAMLKTLIDEVDGLMSESLGVYGMHLNGDPSPWSELEPGGQFERLSSLDEARALVAKVEGM